MICRGIAVHPDHQFFVFIGHWGRGIRDAYLKGPLLVNSTATSGDYILQRCCPSIPNYFHILPIFSPYKCLNLIESVTREFFCVKKINLIFFVQIPILIFLKIVGAIVIGALSLYSPCPITV